MTKIEHIVFDIGKVLIHYDPHIPIAASFPMPTSANGSSRMSAPMTGTSNRIADAAGKTPRRC